MKTPYKPATGPHSSFLGLDENVHPQETLPWPRQSVLQPLRDTVSPSPRPAEREALPLRLPQSPQRGDLAFPPLSGSSSLARPLRALSQSFFASLIASPCCIPCR